MNAADPRQPLTHLAVHRFLGYLDRLDDRYSVAEAHLQTNLDLAVACDAPFEQAPTLVELAGLRSAQSNVDAAQAPLDEVCTICEPLKAQPNLDQVAALEAELADRPDDIPFRLTPRELEVMQLVTLGLTDPEVAEQLFLSPCTVSSYLRSVFNKLDVNSRAAAAARWIELSRD